MTTVTDDSTDPTVPARHSVPERLVRLAERYAAEGDVRRAQMAAWAADVYVLEELLWENGLAEAADPVAQLAAVGEAVAAALETLADGTTGELTPRTVAEAARWALVSTFDESVHDVLVEQLPSLDVLDACDPRAAVSRQPREAHPAAARLEGRSPEDLVAELREAATDCVHIGRVMQVEGEETAADRMTHQADVATFEAYLIAAALHAGDHQLATVDLRWELATELDPFAYGSQQGGDGDSFATLRRELIALVGSAEMETLWRSFSAPEDDS